MIFVTVGTHEQQFNRLVQYMDKWVRNMRKGCYSKVDTVHMSPNMLSTLRCIHTKRW